MIINLDQKVLANLTKTEIEIVRFINKNESKLSSLSIVDIAFETFSSPSTVSRAIRKCGIHGFNELRYKLIANEKDAEVKNVGEIFNKSLIEAQNVIEQISTSDILETIKVFESTEHIYVLGRGLSEYVANEFSFKLQLLGFHSMVVCDPNIMRKLADEASDKDCFFIFSLNGKTEELITSARYANNNGASVINCCCNKYSQLNEFSSINLIGYKHEHNAISKFEVSSRVPLNIIARIIIDYIASN